MTNRILDAYVITHRADPADAELRVMVRPETITPGTHIKGRLMGPRSPYAGTVEIAYPFRELARTDHILLRVLIPEPNFWEPKTPLLYEGPLELWQDDQRIEQIRLRHGIRTVQLGAQGLRVNGKPCRLNGVCADTFTEADATHWHGDGINLVLTPARDDHMELWQLSDRFGLFVLGRIEEPHQWPRWVKACQRYPSFLGCVFSPGVAISQTELAAVPGLRGAEVATDGTMPEGRFNFVLAGADHQLAATVPALLIANANEPPKESDRSLGWVRDRV
jgi:Glycosyl hydrolases family 2